MSIKTIIILPSQTICRNKCLYFKTSMKNLIITSMAIISLGSQAQNTQKKMQESLTVSNIEHKVKIIKFEDLESIIKKKDNKLYVVNFWATWCKPCVLELPEFMEVNKTYHSDPHFKMILMSLDIAKEVESSVQLFLVKNKINTDVYLLDDNKRMNEWIPKVDSRWSGSIPATAFYKNGMKLEFREGIMQKRELEQMISKYL